MSLLERLQGEMVAAMKAREEARLGALRMIKAALKKQEIDSMKPLDEAGEVAVLSTLMKQRRESVEMFRNGGREDLAEKEEAELKLIESYLPALATDSDVEAALTKAIADTGATSAKQMGLVMKAVQANLGGKRVDNRTLSEKVKAKLAPV